MDSSVSERIRRNRRTHHVRAEIRSGRKVVRLCNHTLPIRLCKAASPALVSFSANKLDARISGDWGRIWLSAGVYRGFWGARNRP